MATSKLQPIALQREPNTLSGSVYSTSAMARAFVAIQASKINQATTLGEVSRAVLFATAS
jgi:hypothetical protein